METDRQLLLSKDQAITASAASTDIYDAGGVTALGSGQPLYPFLRVTEAFNTLTSLTIAVQSHDDSAFGAPTTLFSVSVALAGLTLNAVIPLPGLPAGPREQWYRFYYTVVGSNPTTGKITAGFALDKPSNAAVIY